MDNFIIYLFAICLFSSLDISRCNTEEDVTMNYRRHRNHNHYNNNHNFDVLIFTQLWPTTDCFHWMNLDERHKCQLPSPKNIWTIHGIWPTKHGTMGPFNCNSSYEFDVNQIQNLLPSLEQFWTNIEKGTPFDELWRHEWNKHGTCAMQLESLKNETKYFRQGLTWLQQYSMTSILAKSNIVPDRLTTAVELSQAVVKELKHLPVIHCIYDHHSGKNYLSEIRICFTKDLELTGCEGCIVETPKIQNEEYYRSDNILTSCDLSKPVYYPANVPMTRFNQNSEKEWKFPFVNVYKLVRLVKWLTF